MEVTSNKSTGESAKKLKQARLPFKILESKSPVVPTPEVKKRRLSDPTASVHKAAKSAKKDHSNKRNSLGKPGKPTEEEDGAVSSSCEVDHHLQKLSEDSVKFAKPAGLDKFVHKTPKVEVTTSCTEGESIVDLTADSENEAEACSTEISQGHEDKENVYIPTNSVETGLNGEEEEKELDQSVDGITEETDLNNASSLDSSIVSEIEMDTTTASIDLNNKPESSKDCSEQKTELQSTSEQCSAMVEEKSSESKQNTELQSESEQCNALEEKSEVESDKKLTVNSIKTAETGTPKPGQPPHKRIKLTKKEKLERARLKEEKEKQKNEEKEKKEKERLEAKLKKEMEKQEKEREKEEKKRQKDDERKLRLEQAEEEKKKKEEARLEEIKRKEEEKKKKEEEKVKEKEKTSQKEKQLMQKFFVKSSTDATTPARQKTDVGQVGLFRPFELKKNMQLAPLIRYNKSEYDKRMLKLESMIGLQDCKNLYIEELQKMVFLPKIFKKSMLPKDDDVVILTRSVAGGCLMHAKLIQFHDNYRPAYYGTWRKRSRVINPRNPLKKDTGMLDYEVDSDEEWEEEEPGESISHSEGEDEGEEEPVVDEEGDDGFFVPHGYLSEGEGCEEDDEDLSHEKMKAQQLTKARNWEAEMHAKRVEKLRPVCVGICWWDPNGPTNPLQEKMKDFEAVVFESRPISIELSSSSTSSGKPGKTENKDVPGAESKKIDKSKCNFQPVPDSAIPDLIRLVHGNKWSIEKLIREFREFWRQKNQKPADDTKLEAGVETGMEVVEAVSTTEERNGVEEGRNEVSEATHVKHTISKRQLHVKIHEIAAYEKRSEVYSQKLWYVNSAVFSKYGLSDLPVPTDWKWITKLPEVNSKVRQPHIVEAVKPANASQKSSSAEDSSKKKCKVARKGQVGSIRKYASPVPSHQPLASRTNNSGEHVTKKPKIELGSKLPVVALKRLGANKHKRAVGLPALTAMPVSFKRLGVEHKPAATGMAASTVSSIVPSSSDVIVVEDNSFDVVTVDEKADQALIKPSSGKKKRLIKPSSGKSKRLIKPSSGKRPSDSATPDSKRLNLIPAVDVQEDCLIVGIQPPKKVNNRRSVLEMMLGRAPSTAPSDLDRKPAVFASDELPETISGDDKVREVVDS